MTKYLKPMLTPSYAKLSEKFPLKHLEHTGMNPMYAKKVSDTFKVKTESPWTKMKGSK